MHVSFLSPKDWARSEFDGAKLGDARRTQRLLKMAEDLARRPSGTLPLAMGDWGSVKAAYRMLGNSDITYDQIIAPHCVHTQERCATGSHCLLIEDTTSLDYSFHGATRGLGLIGDNGGRGIYVHTTLAVSRGEQEILGIYAQQCWMRPPRLDGKTRQTETAHERLNRSRESQRWAACFEGSQLPPGRFTFVADREADIYDVFERCQAANLGMIIRLRADRALLGDDRKVLQAARESPIRGYLQIAVRGREGQPARVTKLEVRSGALMMRSPAHRPGKPKTAMAVNVLIVRESEAPSRSVPIEWVLLTSWDIEALASCQQVVGAYEARWLIEEYHKCLKSGCGVEDSQLSDGQRLLRLLAILSVVAVRLLDAKLVARRRPEGKRLSQEIGPAALAILTSRYGTPSGAWSNRNVIRHIARLGGFLARKGDGEPGWITIWRGYNELQLLAEGYAMGAKCG